MAKRRKSRGPTLGHISFRLPADVHRDLLRAAQVLGQDLTSLLNALIAEARPALMLRVADIEKRQAAAQRALAEATPPDEASPLVAVAVAAGRGLQGYERASAMVRAAGPQHTEFGPPLAAVLQAAFRVLEREEERHVIESAVQMWEAEKVEAEAAAAVEEELLVNVQVHGRPKRGPQR
jgi:hypothetical protein